MAVVQAHDPERRPKGNFEYKAEVGPQIQIHNAPSDEKEAIEVARIIERALPSQSVLLLFPQGQYAHAIAQELRRRQIPFSAPVSMPGAGMPLVASLAVWLGAPTDNLEFRRCLEAYLNSPSSGVPSKRVKQQKKLDEREAAYKAVSGLWEDLLSGAAKDLWSNLGHSKESNTVLKSAHNAFVKLTELHKDGKDLPGFMACVSKDLAPWRTIPGFLEEATAWIESVSRPPVGSGADVRLMSFQGAKGLQAMVVCVIGLEEGALPRSAGDNAALAEQSRLLFVSMTRAINELHLFHARKRSGAVVHRNIYNKDGGPPDLKPSRFLKAIPREHCTNIFHRA
jgi:superfamily I DNA/RNA helicase